ncbi:hypothetical protein SASPL_134774 [Salvia splendens]|uniref:AP2/ERF domain-containing protein n=1 Tax=Salvia splendens TaxID=180675 RepID=A0A8X8WXE3_SALSN|nr:hypothetical protein SASPL_134774 [Salvia splendens]
MKDINDTTTAAAAADISSWLGFSLSPHMKMEAAAAAATPSSAATQNNSNNFYLSNSGAIFAGADFHAPLSVMPLKSDGSLCLMEALSQSHPPPPKLEDFLGAATIAAATNQEMDFYTHQNHYFSNYSFYQHQIPQIPEEEIAPCLKTWMDHSHSLTEAAAPPQSLSLSMSPGSQSSCITASLHLSETTESAAMETKKRGAQKLGQQKQTVHRKSIDTFGQRTSQYRGVTRHRWTGRYEAHLWDNSCKKEGQTRKGRQGGYDMEDKAARAYDLAALKYWGPSTHINFGLENYHQELEDMKNMSRQEYVAHLRRKSSGFSRGASIYRGVTRHHQHGRWQARIGRVAGNKDLYLGTFSTQEEAAEAYDIAAIKFRGVNAVTNFDISRYDVEKIMASNTLPTGEVARRTKEGRPAAEVASVEECHASTQRVELCGSSAQVEHVSNGCDWKMVLHSDAPVVQAPSGHQGSVGVGSLDVKTLNLGSYQSPTFSVGLHEMMGGLNSSQRGVSNATMAPHFSNASSLVTSLSSSREASPERYGGPNKLVTPPANVGAWIPTTQIRPMQLTTAHMPVFAAWNDAGRQLL